MRRTSVSCALILAALAVPACGPKASDQPVQKADVALDRFLEAWTKGESPDTFAASESIQGTDPEWKAGVKLLSFLSAETKQIQESPSRFRCRVSLSLQDKQGRKYDKEVTYDVQLGDPILIGRASR
jgi:hypothetical protein